MLDKAKRYSNLKYGFKIFGVFYALIILFLFLKLGFSAKLYSGISEFLPHYLSFPAYLALVFLGYYLFELPFNFYQSYILEHKFALSTQSIRGWWFDQIKSLGIFAVIGFILASAFYFILHSFPAVWWLVVSLFWIFFSVILAKITPVLIIPLFFRYKKLADEELRGRILRLAKKMGVKFLDCFEIDFSKKTLKANAAFTGIGNTRRVILADTLKNKYTYDEIEVILAHEFAHFRLKHLLKLVTFNSLSTLAIFYLIFKTKVFALDYFGFSSLSEVSALPVILIYFIIFGIIMQPLEAFISRGFERSADKMALKITGMKEAFVSMMNKLAEQNLADRNPHPIIKFFFFDHPPIDERIRIVSPR